MIDDLLEDIFGDATFDRLGQSRRLQLVARLFFGLLGAGLLGYGAFHFAARQGLTGNLALRASMVLLLASLAGFFLFNVALARGWRWPAWLAVASFVALFVSRIALGP